MTAALWPPHEGFPCPSRPCREAENRMLCRTAFVTRGGDISAAHSTYGKLVTRARTCPETQRIVDPANIARA